MLKKYSKNKNCQEEVFMKQKLLATFLIAALVLGGTACGTGNPGQTNSGNSKNDSQSTVETSESMNQKTEKTESGADTESDLDRQTYTVADINDGKLGDKITFNSITDVAETGNEVDFTSAQEAGADGLAVNPHGNWEGGNVEVEDGKEYVVRLYVHNNSPKGIAGTSTGTSTGTKVAISGIGASKTNAKGKQEVEVNGFIESDNATPKEYWDYVRFYSNTSFHLDYVYGSAMIYNRGATGTTDPISAAEIESKSGEELKALLNSHTVTGKPLGDDIVLKQKADGTLDGQLIGFDALDGNVPGCYEYSSYITIRVKAVYDK